jgi:hypothetical protein
MPARNLAPADIPAQADGVVGSFPDQLVCRQKCDRIPGVPPSNTPTAEYAAALFDVQLLDVLAVIEALLREARELQRQALCVRGIPSPTTAAQRRRAAEKMGTSVRDMREQTAELSGLVVLLEKLAATTAAAAERATAPKQDRTSRA